jgi:pyridoxal phosphate enzyme (YggS family)
MEPVTHNLSPTDARLHSEPTSKRIAERYQQVLERITRVAQSAGRNPDQVRLIVVTKLHPPERVRAVIAAGARYLGENYAEEALAKKIALATTSDSLIDAQSEVEWHIIGHVQSRKARLVCEHFDYLHSLDSLKLARRLEQAAVEFNRAALPVLLEFNLSGEATKSGWPAWQENRWNEFLPDIEQILELSHLRVHGLMTMPPFSEDTEQSRVYFRRLRLLQNFLCSHFPHSDWSELSMGMSHDFEIAVQEGATWVRVGQAIFGPRPGV